jgi:hypothetical protein
MSWKQLAHGGFFDFDKPADSQYTVAELAHALARISRYDGSTQGERIYSVAQHCVLASFWGLEDMAAEYRDTLVADAFAMECLAHDAHEAIIGDISSPVKYATPAMSEAVRALEAIVWPHVAARFRVPVRHHRLVKTVDLRLLATERRDLLAPCARDWCLTEQPYEYKIQPWTVGYAERAFLLRFENLSDQFGRGMVTFDKSAQASVAGPEYLVGEFK